MVDRFRHFCAIDWSGAAGERHKGIAVALCGADGGPPELVRAGHRWSRAEVLCWLKDDLPQDTLAGMDIGMSLPFADCGAFFPGWRDSPGNAKALWALVDRICAVDADLGAASFADHDALSAYFRRHGGRAGSLFHAPGANHRRGRFRVTEAGQAALGCMPYSNFNLVGAAQVGKSSLAGMRVLHRLTGEIAIWPFDPLPGVGSVLVEIYTAIPALAAGRSASRSKMRSYEALNEGLKALGSPTVEKSGPVDDHSADALLAAAWLRANGNRAELWSPKDMTGEIARTEGWTFGAS